MKMLPMLAWGCLLAVACADAKQLAEKRLQQVGAKTLREDAARLYKNVFAGRKSDFEEVKASDWPRSFRQFAPRHVGAYPDGLSLALSGDRRAESGLYIVPAEMEHTPVSTARASFQQLAEGVYWYSFAP